LSDAVRVNLSVEGPAPLTVTVPEDVLDEPSAAVWRVRPAGEATVEDRPGGRQRWTRAFRADPFQPGDPVRLGFAAVRVQAGDNPAVELTPAAVELAVTTGVTDPSPQSARPPTGIEELPPPPTDDWRERLTAWGLGILVALLAVGLVAAVMARRGRRSLPTPHEAAERELAALDSPALTAVEFAGLLSGAVRRFVQRTTAVPATRLTAAELRAVAPEVAPLLAACDRVRFAPADLTPEDRTRLLADARSLVAGPAAGPYHTGNTTPHPRGHP
jgi:hypothetical protein